MPGVRILIPNIETDLTEGEVTLLANELVLLGDSGGAVAADLQRGPEYAIDDENRGTVARALDHLRNHGDLDASDSLVRLRDALVADWPPQPTRSWRPATSPGASTRTPTPTSSATGSSTAEATRGV